jgi:hypothetical protein
LVNSYWTFVTTCSLNSPSGFTFRKPQEQQEIRTGNSILVTDWWQWASRNKYPIRVLKPKRYDLQRKKIRHVTSQFIYSLQPWRRMVGGRSDCCWHSPAQSFLALGFMEIHDQGLCSLLDMCVFRNEASSSARRYVCCTAVSAQGRVYPPVTACRSLWTLHTLL